MAPNWDIIEILIRRGILTVEQGREAMRVWSESGNRLCEIIVHLGYASPDEVMSAVAESRGLEFINLESVRIPDTVIELVPESIARENSILPWDEDDRVLCVIVSDPDDVDAAEKLRFILNREIRIALAPRDAIQRAIDRFY